MKRPPPRPSAGRLQMGKQGLSFVPAPAKPVSAPVQPGPDLENQIVYACVTQNRLPELKRNLEKVLPYVDQVLIVDGGSSQEFVDYLAGLGPKVKRVFRRWTDSFKDQWQFMLDNVDGGWVLLQDCDEFPSTELLLQLKDLAIKSEKGDKYCCVEFRCNPMSIDEVSGDVTWDPGPVNYYRQIYFRHTKRLHYTVDLHQSLQAYQNGKILRREEVYYHVKTRTAEFRSAVRNFFIAGVWPDGSRTGIKEHTWTEMKDILVRNHPDVKLYADLDNLLVSGQICQEFKDWVVKYKDQPGGEYGELRAYYTYWGMLHPDLPI